MGFSRQEILEWVAIPFSWGSSRPRDWTLASRIVRQIFFFFFTIWTTRKAQQKRLFYFLKHRNVSLWLRDNPPTLTGNLPVGCARLLCEQRQMVQQRATRQQNSAAFPLCSLGFGQLWCAQSHGPRVLRVRVVAKPLVPEWKFLCVQKKKKKKRNTLERRTWHVSSAVWTLCMWENLVLVDRGPGSLQSMKLQTQTQWAHTHASTPPYPPLC